MNVFEEVHEMLTVHLWPLSFWQFRDIAARLKPKLPTTSCQSDGDQLDFRKISALKGFTTVKCF